MGIFNDNNLFHEKIEIDGLFSFKKCSTCRSSPDDKINNCSIFIFNENQQESSENVIVKKNGLRKFQVESSATSLKSLFTGEEEILSAKSVGLHCPRNNFQPAGANRIIQKNAEQVGNSLGEIVFTEVVFLEKISEMRQIIEQALLSENLTNPLDRKLLEQSKEACNTIIKNSFAEIDYAFFEKVRQEPELKEKTSKSSEKAVFVANMITAEHENEQTGQQKTRKFMTELVGYFSKSEFLLDEAISYKSFENAMSFLNAHESKLENLIDFLLPDIDKNINNVFINVVQRITRYEMLFAGMTRSLEVLTKLDDSYSTEDLEKSLDVVSLLQASSRKIDNNICEQKLRDSESFISSIPPFDQVSNSWWRRIFGFFNKSTKDNQQKIEDICSNPLLSSTHVKGLVTSKLVDMSSREKKILATCIKKKLNKPSYVDTLKSANQLQLLNLFVDELMV